MSDVAWMIAVVGYAIGYGVWTAVAKLDLLIKVGQRQVELLSHIENQQSIDADIASMRYGASD